MFTKLFLSYLIIFGLIFGFGIIFGSFLNVCILRLPQNESIISGPSHCMSCKKRIKPYDLVPIFSWLVLKGKCRNCGQKISARYPLIEALNGALWVLSYITFGLTIKFLVVAFLFSSLIIIAFMDWDTQEINTGVIVFIGLLAIPSYIFTNDADLFQRLIGSIIISIPFFIIGYLTGGIGFGDVLLMAAAGLLLGFPNVIVATFLGILIASVVGITIKAITKNSKFAFGPWLSIGIAISVMYGTKIVDWYLSLITR